MQKEILGKVVTVASTAKRKNTSGEETRSRIIDATLTTLKTEGIVGTSARNIAKAGDFNQALVFYHFGSVDDLVIAAVADMSRKRLENYRPRLEAVSTLSEMVKVARELHVEDVANDNMKVLTQAFAGAVGNPEVGPKLYAELDSWSDMVTETVERVLADVPAAAIIDKGQIAQAVSSLFLGIELLDGLDSTRSNADALLETLEGLSRLLELVLQMPGLQGLTAPAS